MLIDLVLAATAFARITVVDRPIAEPAIVRDADVLLPLRGTFEALNSTVVYNRATGTIEARNILHTIRINAKSGAIELDGQPRSSIAQRIGTNGELYVPMKLAADAMGAIVLYDPQQNVVSVNGSDHSVARLNDVHAPKELNPPPNATVQTAYPVISASLGDAIAASNAIRLTIDGVNVTPRARFDGRTIAYVPESPLPGGTHNVVFDGTLGPGRPFVSEWTFTTVDPSAAGCYGSSCGYQFYAQPGQAYAGGSFFNLTLIGPPTGSGFAQVCNSTAIYPLWNGGSRWYRARIALPATFASGNCAVNAVFISPTGQRVVVPITSGGGGIFLTGSPLNPIGSYGTGPTYVPIFTGTPLLRN